MAMKTSRSIPMVLPSMSSAVKALSRLSEIF
jgi:hypothetical protein